MSTDYFKSSKGNCNTVVYSVNSDLSKSITDPFYLSEPKHKVRRQIHIITDFYCCVKCVLRNLDSIANPFCLYCAKNAHRYYC